MACELMLRPACSSLLPKERRLTPEQAPAQQLVRDGACIESLEKSGRAALSGARGPPAAARAAARQPQRARAAPAPDAAY